MFRGLTISLWLGSALEADTASGLPDVIQHIRGASQSGDAMRVMRDVYANNQRFTFPAFHARAEYLKKILGVPDRQQFALTENAHKPNGLEVDSAWRAFFDRWFQSTKRARLQRTYLPFAPEVNR
jgi:hypothetical protein